MKTLYLKVPLFLCFFSMMAYAAPNFQDDAAPSQPDQLQIHHKDPIDGGWLPNLTGLPDEAQVESLTNHVIEVMKEETDPRCKAINPALRLMTFQHFAIQQYMANNQGIYYDDDTLTRWAHVLGMILKESSGDTTSITDMRGRAISTFTPQTDLEHWRKILTLPLQNKVKFNYQTNFGLSQTSADRLFLVFKVAKDKAMNTQFLEGRFGLLTQRRVTLNTAIAARRLIWFYQDFSQGRVSQAQPRIHYKQMMNNPQFIDELNEGSQKALLYCGTRFLFDEGDENNAALRKAMSSIAYCKLGNFKAGYGKNDYDATCFAQWVTLCPALNIDIALLTPLSFFETRNEKPVCLGTFNRLLTTKPGTTTTQPATTQPATTQPVTTQPVTDQPVINQPTTD